MGRNLTVILSEITDEMLVEIRNIVTIQVIFNTPDVTSNDKRKLNSFHPNIVKSIN